MKTHPKTNPKTRGFTMFMAILVGGLALSIGIAIFDIALRELDLSVTATQSQYAIYAADTGAECAMYWDFKYGTSGSGSVFATSSTMTVPSSGVSCNGQDIAATGVAALTWPLSSTPTAATTTFKMTLGPAGQYCAAVEVAKYVDTLGVPRTTVTSRGYNTACPPTVAVNRLERALQVRY